MLHTLRWPSACHVCHRWPSDPLCAACVTRFAQPLPRCPRCALTLHATDCVACQETAPPLDACFTAVSYGFPWDGLVARFKFQAEAGLARLLAHLMQHAPHVMPALEAADCVVPMPLSARRLRARGFNQAQVLAERLAGRKVASHWLHRSGEGAHQVGASRAERQALVQDVFWVAPQAFATLKNQRVVLLDDVMTTGASMYAAAAALRTAGVRHITGLVFARAEREHA